MLEGLFLGTVNRSNPNPICNPNYNKDRNKQG